MQLNHSRPLSCPRCKLDIIQKNQVLYCENHKQVGTVVNEIPVFFKDQNFNSHWEKNKLSEISLSKVNVAKEFLEGKIALVNEINILDAGSGDGVHFEVLNWHQNAKNLNYFALDISKQALLAIREKISLKNHLKSIKLIQASVEELPLESNYFDVVICFGVLAYTQNPIGSLKELTRVCKKNGTVGVWIYPDKGGFLGMIFTFVRYLGTHFNGKFAFILAGFIIPFLFFLPTKSKVHLGNSSWRQCLEVVLVNIAPVDLIFPKLEDVKSWFNEAGLTIVEIDESNPLTLWGRKNEKA